MKLFALCSLIEALYALLGFRRARNSGQMELRNQVVAKKSVRAAKDRHLGAVIGQNDLKKYS